MQRNAMQRLGEASRQLQGKTRRGSNIIIQLGPIVPAAWNGSRERIQILLIIYTHNSGTVSVALLPTYLPSTFQHEWMNTHRSLGQFQSPRGFNLASIVRG